MQGCPPVMICGFSRPDCLQRVFDRVREAKPSQLFLALDAPREGRPKDVSGVEACKKVFAEVDWPCEVHRNYAEKNMGCRGRMSSAISWVFEHVDRAIILEDDCVPDLTFFQFCDELLERYKDDERVGMIAGHCELPDYATKRPRSIKHGYYFDYLNTIWGWATWKRAWSKYDATLSFWPGFVEGGGLDCLSTKRRVRKAFMKMVDDTQSGRTSSWAIVWGVSCTHAKMMCLHPANNLMTNIGFGEGATHTKAGEGLSPWANLPTCPVSFPLDHPSDVVCNAESQREVLDRYYAVPLYRRIVSKIARVMQWRRN